jgi:hypothetical protein
VLTSTFALPSLCGPTLRKRVSQALAEQDLGEADLGGYGGSSHINEAGERVGETVAFSAQVRGELDLGIQVIQETLARAGAPQGTTIRLLGPEQRTIPFHPSPDAEVTPILLDQDPPFSAEDACVFAESAIATARDQGGLQLDFSPGSLVQLDQLLQGMPKIEDAGAVLPAVVKQLGCYLGEVIIRNHGGKWRRTARSDFWTQPGALQFPLFLQLPGGVPCNPLRLVLKRLGGAAETSLPAAYEKITSGELQAWAAAPHLVLHSARGNAGLTPGEKQALLDLVGRAGGRWREAYKDYRVDFPDRGVASVISDDLQGARRCQHVAVKIRTLSSQVTRFIGDLVRVGNLLLLRQPRPGRSLPFGAVVVSEEQRRLVEDQKPGVPITVASPAELEQMVAEEFTSQQNE